LRILLDAHVSGKRIANALRDAGHDVRAISEERDLEGLDDPDVLSLAAHEGRILVTFNHRDFVPLLREWSEAGRPHAGCVLVFGIDHSRFAEIRIGLERIFSDRPAQEDWTDITQPLSRSQAR
jgi:hypothetical protein